MRCHAHAAPPTHPPTPPPRVPAMPMLQHLARRHTQRYRLHNHSCMQLPHSNGSGGCVEAVHLPPNQNLRRVANLITREGMSVQVLVTPPQPVHV